MLNKAIEIANRAHEGQVDKAGAPYILHPLRVMMSLENEHEQISAVLHDVVEDSDITLDDLRGKGFSEDVVQVIDCLTKRAGESYNDFIGRILENETACRVKLADLCDNMDITRIKNPTDKDTQRIKRYQEAADRISEALPLADGIENQRVIEINGCVSIQPYLSHDEFLNRFILFVEMNGWFFGGGTVEVTEKAES